MDSKSIDPLDDKMPSKQKPPQIPLSKSWEKYVKSGILHVFALAQCAHRRPRIEPRERWPRGAPCAKPQTLIAGKPGQRFEMVESFHEKRRHLPVVKLNRAA